MDVTKLSTKGQIVIPEKLRKQYKEGSSFVVTQVNDLLILKPVLGLTPQEEKEMKELKATWNEFDNGKLEVHSEDEFIQEMNKW
jgi:AbrB family looped-hinge helix DNA binding protein